MMYIVKSFTARCKELTGKELDEWRQILGSRPHLDRLAACEFLKEQGMPSNVNFIFILWLCHAHIKYLSKTSRPLPGEKEYYQFLQDVVRNAKEERHLHNVETLDEIHRVEIYFEGGDLVIDSWILTSRYEDEKSIIIYNKSLPKLCQVLNAETGELIRAIKERFSGSGVFNEIEHFLGTEMIRYRLCRR